MRIHILGAPGSGKTTLAAELSSRFQIPHYNLDRLHWEPENIIANAGRPSWVAEGIYLVWTEPLLYQADYIVLLEISWPVAAWRMIRRHIMNSIRGTNLYPGLNGIKALIKLVKDTHRYILNRDHHTHNKSSGEALHACLEAQQGLSAPPSEDFLKTYIESYLELSIPPTDEFVRRYLAKYKEKIFLVGNRADRERLLDLLTKI